MEIALMGWKPGPHSRADKRLVADRRLAPARRARRHIEDLTEHIGGHPTATQRLLIERTAMVLVRLSYLDEKILSGMDLTDYDNRTYHYFGRIELGCLLSVHPQ